MVGLSMKDCKLVQGISQYTFSDAEGSIRVVIRGLGFYDDFYLLLLIHFFYCIILLLFWKTYYLYNLTMQGFFIIISDFLKIYYWKVPTGCQLTFSNHLSGRGVQYDLEDRREDQRQCFSEIFVLVLSSDFLDPYLGICLTFHFSVCKLMVMMHEIC